MFVRVSMGQKAIYPSLILPLIICLFMPESIHSNVAVLPFALLFGFSVRVMASTFENIYKAELVPDQVDENSLPPYDFLDPILKRYLELDQSAEEIIALASDVKTSPEPLLW